ncbi:hypothetical protein Syun_008953 [Stephania yunnanensis]|uniref:Serine-threonine/tyrosine-protein kinase catalytic domain-containing protein n=1 Tax=Stephania yunnanensis TaxID=152371 RepID=A0AAP0KFN5_9MAGN
MVAVMERGGSKRARQLGNCLDHKGSGVLLDLWTDMMPENQEMYVTTKVLGTFGYFDPEYTSVRHILTDRKKLRKVIDPNMNRSSYNIESIAMFANLAFHCVRAESTERPSMTECQSIGQNNTTYLTLDEIWIRWHPAGMRVSPLCQLNACPARPHNQQFFHRQLLSNAPRDAFCTPPRSSHNVCDSSQPPTPATNLEKGYRRANTRFGVSGGQ